MSRMPTPARSAIALALVALLAPTAAAAAGYPDPDDAPRRFSSSCLSDHNRRFVYDYEGVVTDAWGTEIEGAACDVYARTGAHVVLVAVPDTAGEPIENYALHLFEAWGIGEKDRNDGILLLYVRDYALDGRSSAVRVEVGYGLEAAVTSGDAMDAVRLMRDAKARALAAGENEGEALAFALASGAHYLLTILNDEYADGRFPEPRPGPAPIPFWVVVLAILMLVVVLLAVTASRDHGRTGGWGYYPHSRHWSRGIGSVFVGGGGLGGGGLGGGGGFGGGRSGGGGGSGGL